jgi:hypothetical protein
MRLRYATLALQMVNGIPDVASIDMVLFGNVAAPARPQLPGIYSLREKPRCETAGLYLKDKLPDSKVFPMWQRNGAKMLRVDLKAAGIPYKDDQSHYADFHALRHSFITNLANSGVHPKTAQALARHSSITLTMDRYTHSALESQAEAVSLLPDMSNGKSALEGQDVLASCLAFREEKQASGRRFMRQEPKPHYKTEPPASQQLTGGSVHRKTGGPDGARTRNHRIDSPVL